MLLDSNIVIYAFQPEYRNSALESFLLKGEFSVSDITRLEVLGYWRNSDAEYQQFTRFFEATNVIGLSAEII